MLTVASETDHQIAVSLVRDITDRVEWAASTWRDDSEISHLNRSNGRPAIISSLLMDILSETLRAAERTRGMVDPTVGCVTLPGAPVGVRLTRGRSWRDIHLDSARKTITVPAGVTLDLGAIGKAYTADLAAETVAQILGIPVLTNLGGDLRVCGPPLRDGWQVLVTDDHRQEPDRRGGTDEQVVLTSGAIATSSTTVRRRQMPDGRTVAHVVDPRTLWPAMTMWRTVSVCATTCVEANTASTAALVLGKRAVDFLHDTGLPARLVGHDGRVVHLGSWPSEQRVATS